MSELAGRGCEIIVPFDEILAIKGYRKKYNKEI